MSAASRAPAEKDTIEERMTEMATAAPMLRPPEGKECSETSQHTGENISSGALPLCREVVLFLEVLEL